MAAASPEGRLDACCLTEYRPLPGTPKGKLTKVGNILTYEVIGNEVHSVRKAIVILTDIFGLTKNPRITADELSKNSGFDVYVPDIFGGDAIPSSWLKNFPDTPGENVSFGSKITMVGQVVTSLGPWLFRHRQTVTWPIVEHFFKALREEKNIEKIQAVGYCFGGLYALLAGGHQSHLVDTVVGCHVSLTNRTHFQKVRVPAAFVCAEQDDQFSNSQRIEAEKILCHRSEIPSHFLLTKGTVHGFAARPNPDNPAIMAAYEQANQFIVQWAKTHL